jgi:hypothetical protein
MRHASGDQWEVLRGAWYGTLYEGDQLKVNFTGHVTDAYVFNDAENAIMNASPYDNLHFKAYTIRDKGQST